MIVFPVLILYIANRTFESIHQRLDVKVKSAPDSSSSCKVDEIDPQVLRREANHLTMEHWQVPNFISRQYKRHGSVERLFEWQADALCASRGNPLINYNYEHCDQKLEQKEQDCESLNDTIFSTTTMTIKPTKIDCTAFQGQNLIYQAPTSGGKSLVAEILMLKHLIHNKRNVLVVLPFVSLIVEKLAYLHRVWKNAPISVLGLYGGHAEGIQEFFDSVKVRNEALERKARSKSAVNWNTALLCTIEKGNSIINKLILDGEVDNLGMLVIDEVHMVGDGPRGALLELLMSKIRKYSPNTQIVGFSATLANVETMAAWLEAASFVTTHRPCSLRKFIIYDGFSHDEQGRPVGMEEFLYSKNDPCKISKPKISNQLHQKCKRKRLECRCNCCRRSEMKILTSDKPIASIGNPNQKLSKKWTVVYAPSGRSRCRVTGTLIPKNSMRIGQQVESCHNGITTKTWHWYKPVPLFTSQNCHENLKKELAKVSIQDLQGMSKLRQEDQKKIQSLVQSSFRNSKRAIGNINLMTLVLDVIHQRKQALVFCATKKWCKQAANMLWSALCGRNELNNISNDTKSVAPSKLQRDCQSERAMRARAQLISDLKHSPEGLCPDLEKFISAGIAYHNTNLTTEERKSVENAFRNGVLSVLTATSTLAVGVNLPADRVIIRSPQISTQSLDSQKCQQMAGRAGRTGNGDGDAFLILDDTDTSHDSRTGIKRRLSVSDGVSLLCGHPKQIASFFTNPQFLRRAVLELVALQPQKGVWEANLWKICEMSYFVHAMQNQDSVNPFGNVRKTVTDSLRFLCDANFILAEKCKRNNSSNVHHGGQVGPSKESVTFEWKFKPTRLGTATLHCAMDCIKVMRVKRHFEKASQRLFLLSDLHLLYLLTPFCAENACAEQTITQTDSLNVKNKNHCQKYSNVLEHTMSGLTCRTAWSKWNTYLNNIVSDDHPTMKVASLIGIKRSVLQQVVLIFVHQY